MIGNCRSQPRFSLQRLKTRRETIVVGSAQVRLIRRHSPQIFDPEYRFQVGKPAGANSIGKTSLLATALQQVRSWRARSRRSPLAFEQVSTARGFRIHPPPPERMIGRSFLSFVRAEVFRALKAPCIQAGARVSHRLFAKSPARAGSRDGNFAPSTSDHEIKATNSRQCGGACIPNTDKG